MAVSAALLLRLGVLRSALWLTLVGCLLAVGSVGLMLIAAMRRKDFNRPHPPSAQNPALAVLCATIVFIAAVTVASDIIGRG